MVAALIGAFGHNWAGRGPGTHAAAKPLLLLGPRCRPAQGFGASPFLELIQRDRMRYQDAYLDFVSWFHVVLPKQFMALRRYQGSPTGSPGIGVPAETAPLRRVARDSPQVRGKSNR